MTEPTLPELREMARRTITRRHHESEEGMLATAFLALTDPEPLTDEHCRESGLELDRVCKAVFVDHNANESLMVWTDLSEMAVKHPTRGQLLLALSQENRDGE